MNKRLNQEAKILIAMLLIPFITMGYFIFYVNVQTKIDDEKVKNTELAKVMAYYLDNYFQSIRFSLNTFDNLTERFRDNSELTDTLRDQALRYNTQGYFVLDKTGKQMMASYWVEDKFKQQLGIDQSLLEQVQGKGLMMKIISPQDNSVRVMVLRGLRDRHGALIGFAGTVVSLKQIAEVFGNIRVNNNGFVLITNRKGDILVGAGPTCTKGSALKGMKNSAQFLAAIKGEPGSREFVSPYDGKHMLFAYAPIRETNWIVLLVEPETDLQVAINGGLSKHLAIYILAGLAVLVLYYYSKLIRLRRLNREALKSEKLAMVGQLAAGMAHEIRNPLTSIKGFLQMLMAENLAEKNTHRIEIMLEETDRIEDIIRETLLLAKPQKEKIVTFDLIIEMKRIIPVLEAEGTMRNVGLNFDLPKGIILVQGDINHFKQAIINVVKNALEASTSGSCVEIRVQQGVDQAIVVVKDRGAGIDAKILDKIGTPFFTTKESGTGLGMMVTLRIIENMNGKMFIQSEVGNGTQITIKLPLQKNS